MNKSLRELSTERTMAQVCEYGDKRIAELESQKSELLAALEHIQRTALDCADSHLRGVVAEISGYTLNRFMGRR